jgi:hypothetical protein
VPTAEAFAVKFGISRQSLTRQDGRYLAYIHSACVCVGPVLDAVTRNSSALLIGQQRSLERCRLAWPEIMRQRRPPCYFWRQTDLARGFVDH